jgi:hypothetical protein
MRPAWRLLRLALSGLALAQISSVARVLVSFGAGKYVESQESCVVAGPVGGVAVQDLAQVAVDSLRVLAGAVSEGPGWGFFAEQGRCTVSSWRGPRASAAPSV